ncbi:MAG: efflux RND transporter periplasmic adaptor subunit [Mucinivorans sp.]
MAKKRNKKKIIIWGVICLIILGVVIKKVFAPIPLVGVQIEKPATREIIEFIAANGRVQPVVEVKIAPEVSGEIVELPIKEGDYVEKGQLLVRIKPDTYVSVKERIEASVNSNKAQLLQVEAQLVGAKQTYERQKQLYEQKAISTADFETAENSYNALVAQRRTAQFNIKSAEASLKEADEQLFKTTIFAPSAGTISKLNVELGERVVGTATMAGTELLRMADLSQMEVRAQVNENDIVRVALGDSATIEVDAFVGRKFKGRVTRVANSSQNSSTAADQVTSFEVRIYIEPSSYVDLKTQSLEWPMRPGMSSTVNIETDRKTALSLPIGAITTRIAPGKSEREDVIFTYHKDSSTVKVVPIKTGIQDKLYIETQELDSTTQVVVGPFMAVSKELANGQKVEIQKTEIKK